MAVSRLCFGLCVYIVRYQPNCVEAVGGAHSPIQAAHTKRMVSIRDQEQHGVPGSCVSSASCPSWSDGEVQAEA